MSEFQKPYNEIGRLNHELIFTKQFPLPAGADREDRKIHMGAIKYQKFCGCRWCVRARRDLKEKVNKLAGRKFYKDV